MFDEREEYVVDEIIEGRPYFESRHVDYSVARDGRNAVWGGMLAGLTGDEVKAIVESGKPLDIELIDLKDNSKPYRAIRSVNEDWYFQRIELTQFTEVEADLAAFTHSIHDYGIAGHFCPCHREGEIVGEQPAPSGPHGENCIHGRWMIRSATHPTLPGVNVYREWIEQS